MKSKSAAPLAEDVDVASAEAALAPVAKRYKELDDEFHFRRLNGGRRSSIVTLTRALIAGAVAPAAALTDEELAAETRNVLEQFDELRRKRDEARGRAALQLAERERAHHRRLVKDLRDALVQLQTAVEAESAYRIDLAKRGGSTVGMPNFGRLAHELGIFSSYSIAKEALRAAEKYLAG